jgi:hypothetical protein
MSLSGKTRLRLISFLLCISVVPLGSGWELQAPKKPRSKKQAQAKPLPQLPPGPLQPLNLDQVPASPPQVSYQAGQLTITAQNSTLGDILRAVRSKTGATFDIPANANERVVGRLGPGPPREVLASLLNGSRFDYVMLGSTANPTAIEQLILTPKSGGTAAGGVQPAEVGNIAQPPPGKASPEMQNGEEAADNSDANNGNTDNNDADAAQDNTDQGDQSEAQAEDAQDNGQQQNRQQVRTPEQLLQELQQQQQRMQQQQQQGLQPGQPQVVAPVPGQPPNSQPPHQE